jgi:hypothetical protein
VAAVLGVADGSEIGVVGRPVEDLAERSDDDQQEKRRADAADRGEQRIVERDAERARDQQRLQTPVPGERQQCGSQHKAAGEDCGLCDENGGDRDA